MRGVIIVAATLTALIAMVVGVVGAGLHRIAAERRLADDSWHRPDPSAAINPTTNPSDAAATGDDPATAKFDSIDLWPKDAKVHGEIQLVDPLPGQGYSMRGGLGLVVIGPRRRFRDSMRGNPNSTYLSGFRTADDFAEWQIDVPKPGSYEINLAYACPNSDQNGNFAIRIGDKELSLSLETTGSETNFRVITIGKLTLEAGKTLLTFRPAAVSQKSQVTMNLRSVQLIPSP